MTTVLTKISADAECASRALPLEMQNKSQIDEGDSWIRMDEDEDEAGDIGINDDETPLQPKPVPVVRSPTISRMSSPFTGLEVPRSSSPVIFAPIRSLNTSRVPLPLASRPISVSLDSTASQPGGGRIQELPHPPEANDMIAAVRPQDNPSLDTGITAALKNRVETAFRVLDLATGSSPSKGIQRRDAHVPSSTTATPASTEHNPPVNQRHNNSLATEPPTASQNTARVVEPVAQCPVTPPATTQSSAAPSINVEDPPPIDQTGWSTRLVDDYKYLARASWPTSWSKLVDRYAMWEHNTSGPVSGSP